MHLNMHVVAFHSFASLFQALHLKTVAALMQCGAIRQLHVIHRVINKAPAHLAHPFQIHHTCGTVNRRDVDL